MQYVAECRQNGIDILMPDIMKSERGWVVEEDSLRCGYSAIMYLGENTVINHKTTDLGEFIKNNRHLNKRAVESMIKAGMFPGDRGKLIAYNEDFRGYLAAQENAAAKLSEFTASGKKDRIDFWTKRLQSLVPPKLIREVPIDISAAESEALGFSLHDILDQYNTAGCNGTNIICGEVLTFRTKLDKKKNKMAFVMMRTKKGLKELVMFHRNFRDMTPGKVYIVELEDTRIKDLMEAKKIA